MSHRIGEHPILHVRRRKSVNFTFDGRELTALDGEMVSSALFANGVHIFGRHHVDDTPQGIFCANGQCGQCLVMIDGVPMKSCLVPVEGGMRVHSLVGYPELPTDDAPVSPSGVPEVETEVLVVGGGPAGLSAAIELARMDVGVIVADDKHELGGKLSLQTHNFFGSTRDCMAGTRGMDIGTLLTEEVMRHASIEVWLDSPVVAVFVDGKVGIVRGGRFTLVTPKVLLVAAGAREKALAFHGCNMPGIYGAGAFQTLVNRDLVKAASKLFIVGGGNVGLIAAYHALQAGIDVVGLVEALPECGGYKVHLDKIKRLGIPVYTSHTILKAWGDEQVERVTIARLDERFRPIEGTELDFEVDTVLIAVGLEPVNELTRKARAFGIRVYEAGDAAIIAEASAAMFSGKITGKEMLRDMGHKVDIPREWLRLVEVLRSKPGPRHELREGGEGGHMVYPVIRCIQEIPCNPCTDACPRRLISIRSEDISGTPQFEGSCLGCGRCVALCPGLAIALVDWRYDGEGDTALVTIPWEMPGGTVRIGDEVATAGFEGEVLGKARVVGIKNSPWQNRRRLLALEVPAGEADRVAGIRLYTESREMEMLETPPREDDDVLICRCERVTKGKIRSLVRAGVRDFNELKAATRIGMGECGGKTCLSLIWRIFREEGVDLKDVREHVARPFTQEVPMKAFLGVDE